MASVSVFLWFQSRGADAYNHYRRAFSITEGQNADASFMMGTLEIPGATLQIFQGGPHHSFNDAISLFVSVDTQAEIDQLSDALIAGGGSQGNCGWLKDPFGVSWQVVPNRLGELLGNPDRAKAGAVHAAMMTMHRLDLAALEAAASA